MSDVRERLHAYVGDRYAIEREIGRGGMATVYVARDVRHGRLVALKVFRPELATMIGRERFLREIEIAAKLIHPNILPLYDSGEAGDLLYYVMPYVEGETLRSRLSRERQLSIPDAIQIAREVADALSHAHRHGIVHRDIKPENVLLEDTHAVVADFGIARALTTAGGRSLTTAGLIVGTPSYMSPEQAAGDELIDHRSDIYSLGCVLYEMLAGGPPFVGHSQAVKAGHIAGTPAPLRTQRPSVPDELQRVVDQALAKVPADRFASAADFARALGAIGAPKAKKRWDIRQVGAFVAIPVAVVVAVFLLARDRLAGSSNVSPSGMSVVVLPFEYAPTERARAEGDATAHQQFAEAIEALPQLRAIDGSSVVESGESWRAVPFAELLRRVRQLRARYVVMAGVASHEGARRVTVDVYASRDGERVSSSSVQVPPGGLRPAMGHVALDVIRRIAERDSLAITRQASLLSSTSSAFALRHLMDGQRKFWQSDFDGAAAAFESAIAEDSACALAYHRLSVAQIWRHDFPRALAAAEAGLKRHPLGSRWNELLEGQRHYARSDGRKSIEAFQQSVLDEPANIDGWLGVGEALIHFGWFAGHALSDATLALRRVMALDSNFAPIAHHLLDLAVYRGDETEARRWLREFPPNDPQHASRVALVALRFGSEKERADALRQLAEAERYTISHLVAVLMQGSFDVPLADTVSAYLAAAGRTPDDRVRGAQYRLVTRAALGRWDDGLSAWQAASPSSNLDGWLVQAYFAGRPVQHIVAPMFAEARRRVVTGGGPNFTLPVWHDDQQAFLAVAHRALVEGSMEEVRDLLKRLASAAPRADPSDPLPTALESSLEARLAILRGDTARAVAFLEQSVARILTPITPFYPLTAMSPQRLLLARLLGTRHDTPAASRWLDSFDRSPSVADALFADTVRLMAERYGHRPDRGR